MSTLATRGEVFKLAQALALNERELAFLHALPAEPLRQFRWALSERLFNDRAPAFRRVGAIARWVPRWLAVWLCHHWLGPLLTARVAGEMPGGRAADIAQRLPAEFMADVGRHLDPRHAHELLRHLSRDTVLSIAGVLLARRDHATLGRFVQFVNDDIIRAVLDVVPDEAALLEIAFCIESKSRLDHLVRILPPERVRKSILIITDRAQRALWPKVLALLSHVGYQLKRELGELAAAQGPEMLDAIVQAAQEEELWEDLLPVVCCLSPQTLGRLVNLQSLRDPAVMRNIVHAADAHLLWSSVLPLVELMEDAARAAIVPEAAKLPRESLERIAYASLLGEHWDTLLDLVRRMPAERQRECAEIIRAYGTVDPDLLTHVATVARRHGLELELEPGAMPPSPGPAATTA